jgi:GTP pyrophosphokinase
LSLSEHQPRQPITIRGTEDMAVQFASCCRPIPGDPILAQIKGGQGLVIHTHDCPAIHPYKYDPEKWVDVQWDPFIDRLFKVDIRMTVNDRRGVLAKLAAEIATADSNIAHIHMEDQNNQADQKYASMWFTLEVRHRMHLASVLRQLRHMPEVVRITRVKSGASKEARARNE